MEDNPYRGPVSPDLSGEARPTRSVGRAIFKVLAAVGVVLLLLALLLPAVRTVPEASRRNHCSNMLKQIALALQNYHDVYHGFPPAYTVDDSGRPLHSWRTLILPYIEERALYKTIDLSKPWDDPANAAACQLALDEYQCPSSPHEGNRTSYLAIVTPNSCLRPGEPRPMRDIKDGTSKTLIVIEVDADHEVPWMSPRDADEKLLLGLGPDSKLSHSGRGVNAIAADASVHFLVLPIPADTLRALISIDGGDNEVLGFDY